MCLKAREKGGVHIGFRTADGKRVYGLFSTDSPIKVYLFFYFCTQQDRDH